jgi:hypothetical protein
VIYPRSFTDNRLDRARSRGVVQTGGRHPRLDRLTKDNAEDVPEVRQD